MLLDSHERIVRARNSSDDLERRSSYRREKQFKAFRDNLSFATKELDQIAKLLEKLLFNDKGFLSSKDKKRMQQLAQNQKSIEKKTKSLDKKIIDLRIKKGFPIFIDLIKGI